MEVDRVRARLRAQVVHAAQEVVWMSVHRVCPAWCQHIDPASGEVKWGVVHFEKCEYVARGLVDKRDQRSELGIFMLLVAGLPCGAAMGAIAAPAQGVDVRYQIPIQGFVTRWLEAALPHESRKETDDVRS